MKWRWIIPLGAAFLLTDIDSGCACSFKVNAYRAAMKSDLRILAMMESRYRDKHGTYSADLAALDLHGSYPSRGVLIELLNADGTGWLARARHEQLTSTCTMGSGQHAPVSAAAQLSDVGAIVCDPFVGDPYRTVALARFAAVSWAIVVVAALVGLGLVRRRGAPRTPVVVLIGLVAIHPLWRALWLVAEKASTSYCGADIALISIFFAAGASLLLFVQWGATWTPNRPRPTP